MTTPFVVLGAGGHATVVADVLRKLGEPVLGSIAPDTGRGLAGGVRILGGDEVLVAMDPGGVRLANGVGAATDSSHRRDVFLDWQGRGFHFPALVHPDAIIGGDVHMADGAQVFAGAVIQPGCSIGANAIINTRASVDHHCVIGAHCHVAPGVTLLGDVVIGETSLIGAGSTVIQGVTIGREALVAAGSVIIRDVPDQAFLRGEPARERER